MNTPLSWIKGKRELHEEDRLTDFVNHADTLNELTDLIEDENEKVSKKFKKAGEERRIRRSK